MQPLSEKIVPALLAWYEKNHRDLPWRRDRQPYHVWVSEIMLQQTRVEAAKGYYERFLQELGTVQELAACEPDRLMKLWEGLGYYTRARSLQKAAKYIVENCGGCFPNTYDAILSLPGVGPYTAGAIASVCFDLPTPAVDGNVLRVLSRVQCDEAPVTKQSVKEEYTRQLERIYPAGQCGSFTQALMELGATVCLPNGHPRCQTCPLKELCQAEKTGAWQHLPVKEGKKPRKQEEKTVFFLSCGDLRAVRKRPAKGLLAGLWELPNVEGKQEAADALRQLEQWGLVPRELEKSVEKVHIFTHIQWNMRCFYVQVENINEAFTWVNAARFQSDIALPTAFRMFWEEREC